MATQNTGSALATALRVLGVLGFFGGFFGGGTMAFDQEMGGQFLVIGIIFGLINGLVCFALAKCVQAATAYLNSLQQEDDNHKIPSTSTIRDSYSDRHKTKRPPLHSPTK